MAAVAPFAVSAAARAATCGDQTCPKNWECRSEPAPTPGIACAPGADCAVPEPTTVEYCAPLPCSSNADCASDMVCYSETHTECDDPPPCAKDADCAAPADVACTSVTQSACVPRYVPPCGTDSDCGVGFTCEAQQDCSCGGSTGSAGGGPTPSSGSGSGSSSGSAGSSGSPAAPSDGGAADPLPAEDGGAAPPDTKMAPDAGAPPANEPPPECVCTPSKTKACKLVEVGCNAASDCPAGFTCEDNPSGSCWASSDGSSGCDVPDPAKICAPPYTDLVNGAGRAEDGGGELGVPTGSTGTGAPEPPKGGSGDGNSGTGGGSTGGSNSSAGSGAQAQSDPEAAPHDAAQDSDETTVTHAGCSITNAPDATTASYGLVALGLAGLFGARRRRR